MKILRLTLLSAPVTKENISDYSLNYVVRVARWANTLPVNLFLKLATKSALGVRSLRVDNGILVAKMNPLIPKRDGRKNFFE